jgi:hypothetical protein
MPTVEQEINRLVKTEEIRELVRKILEILIEEDLLIIKNK